MRRQQLRHHRHHFLEDLTSFLPEQQFIPAPWRNFGGRQKTELVANIVRELRLQARPQNLEHDLAVRFLQRFDHDRGGSVAEDEVTVTIAKVQMTAADFGRDHQHAPCTALAYRIHRRLDAEGGRGAGHVHVVAEAPGPEGGLQFHGDRRISALHVRTSHDHGIDLVSTAAGALQRLLGSGRTHFAHQRGLSLATRTNRRAHAIDVEHTVAIDHVSAVNTRGLDDELAAGRRQSGNRAGLDLGRVGLVVFLDVGIE